MGNPVSVVVSNLFMEDHEEKATMAQPEMNPKIWRRYVDDLLAIIKKNQRDPFTDHLNNIHPTRSIKFTDAPEVEKTISFLDAQFTRKEDGTLKVKV